MSILAAVIIAMVMRIALQSSMMIVMTKRISSSLRYHLCKFFQYSGFIYLQFFYNKDYPRQQGSCFGPTPGARLRHPDIPILIL
jgi:hypothetical protein